MTMLDTPTNTPASPPDGGPPASPPASPLASVYGRTLMLDKLFSYCPGCGHGIVTRLVAETI